MSLLLNTLSRYISVCVCVCVCVCVSVGVLDSFIYSVKGKSQN